MSKFLACETAIPNAEFRASATQVRMPDPEPRFPNVPPRAADSGPRLSRQQLQFLLRVAPAAVASQREYEVPACVTMAQAILESSTPKFGWGSSPLFRLANNPFGIKYCHFGPGGPGVGAFGHRTVSPSEAPKADKPVSLSAAQPTPSDYGHFDVATWEVENGQKKVLSAEFQRFPNLAEAFRAHALLLRGPRYRPAFEVRGDWTKFAERLGPKASQNDSEHCGYSTNPGYSAELIKLVGLYRLNDPRALEWFATGQDPGHRVIEPPDHRAVDSSGHPPIGPSTERLTE
jgi:flagellum-specific peptidoglycan hydrolase FlgJ